MYQDNVQRVFDAMTSLAEGNELLASYEQIAAKAGCPRRTVARAINVLCGEGKISRIHAKGRGITNIYTISKGGS